MGQVMGRTILEMDEPEHRLTRALVAGSFRSKVLERWEEGLVALVVNELVDSFVSGAGRISCATSPSTSPSRSSRGSWACLGPTTSGSSAGRLRSRASPPTGNAASPPRRPCGTIRGGHGGAPHFARRRPHQRPGAGRDRRRAAERRGDLLVPAPVAAGRVETTYRASGSLLFGLLHDRAQLEALYADRSLFLQAFEEAVRWEPPVTVILRAPDRTELAGVKIDEGADVAL